MPTRMSRTGRYATVTALAALVLGACASNDADRGDVVDALTEAGVPDSQAECAGDRFEEQFNQDQLNDIAEADEPDNIPEGLWTEVEAILSECIGGEEPADEGTDTTESTESGESTETTDTTASGEPSESSTTTAGE
jgi:hypothetical protein